MEQVISSLVVLNNLSYPGEASADAEPRLSFTLDNGVGGPAHCGINATAVGLGQVVPHRLGKP
jgi:hypothetical protein